MKPTMVTTDILWSKSPKGFFDRRLRLTYSFVGNLRGRVGDAGEHNPFILALYPEASSIRGDLDTCLINRNYDIITCFEVLEHLFNPLHFMTEARRSLTDGGRMYMSFPSRPSFLWGSRHFHEIGRKRFRWLCEAAGFEIVRHETHRFTYKWWYYLTGVRPLLRLFFARWNLYELAKV